MIINSNETVGGSTAKSTSPSEPEVDIPPIDEAQLELIFHAVRKCIKYGSDYRHIDHEAASECLKDLELDKLLAVIAGIEGAHRYVSGLRESALLALSKLRAEQFVLPAELVVAEGVDGIFPSSTDGRPGAEDDPYP
jgi:hypothetical protein